MEEPCRFGLVEFRSTTEKSWSNRYSLSGSDFFFVSLLNSWNEALTGLTQPSLSEFYLSWMDSLEIWPTISWCRRGAEFFFLLFKVSEEREKLDKTIFPVDRSKSRADFLCSKDLNFLHSFATVIMIAISIDRWLVCVRASAQITRQQTSFSQTRYNTIHKWDNQSQKKTIQPTEN